MAVSEHDNVFFFIPNLIGYARIVLAMVAFWFMSTNYVVAGWCYVISALLDAVDGHAARAFNQSTRFGAMLDQLTDRCGTTGLLVTLSYFYPQYMFWFQVSIAIDIACHWLYMQTPWTFTFQILAIAMAPFAVVKSLISCLHAYVASIDLVSLDVREREAKRQKEGARKLNKLA